MALVVLAMSGGVDSSVAAQLLLEKGHHVVGVFMRHGVSQPTCDSPVSSTHPMLPIASGAPYSNQGCCTARDAEDARDVSEMLGLDFYALNLQEDFDRIMDYFVDEYVAGRTPNPCVMCNHWIKFGKLFEYANSIGADYVATGHYARIMADDKVPMLARGIDSSKDQSYVLFGIRRSLLSQMLLPVGDYQKSEIRRRASELGLVTADKRDSQEICFVAPGKHADFVADRRGDMNKASGKIVDRHGSILGCHDGIERFTIGQRKGIGVAHTEPLYVVKIDAQSNEIVVGPHADLAKSELTAKDANWFVDHPPKRCLAQIRYNSSAQPASLTVLENGRFHVQFDSDCYGVAPGQAVVCYNGDLVLGGGWIESP